MIDHDFIAQIKDAKVTERTEVKVYVHWMNTEHGRDPMNVYEKVGNVFVNVYNRDLAVGVGDPFYDTLNEIYNNAQKKEA